MVSPRPLRSPPASNSRPSIMQTFRYDHLPTEISTTHVALYADVQNSAALRSRIVRASQLEGAEGDAEREAVNFAFIEARLVCTT